MSPFLNTFLSAANTAAADNFSNFFNNILIVNYAIYKRCKFQKGFQGQIFFKWALKSKKQDVKNYCNTKMPQHFHSLFFSFASFRRGSSAKIFFKQTLKSKELDVIMGEQVVQVLPFFILYMCSALCLGPTLATMSLLFTPYSPQPIK